MGADRNDTSAYIWMLMFVDRTGTCMCFFVQTTIFYFILDFFRFGGYRLGGLLVLFVSFRLKGRFLKLLSSDHEGEGFYFYSLLQILNHSLVSYSLTLPLSLSASVISPLSLLSLLIPANLKRDGHNGDTFLRWFFVGPLLILMVMFLFSLHPSYWCSSPSVFSALIFLHFLSHGWFVFLGSLFIPVRLFMICTGPYIFSCCIVV